MYNSRGGAVMCAWRETCAKLPQNACSGLNIHEHTGVMAVAVKQRTGSVLGDGLLQLHTWAIKCTKWVPKPSLRQKLLYKTLHQYLNHIFYMHTHTTYTHLHCRYQRPLTMSPLTAFKSKRWSQSHLTTPATELALRSVHTSAKRWNVSTVLLMSL